MPLFETFFIWPLWKNIHPCDQGYTFDFIEGEMHEKSPFTFKDFIKQRKRWIQGFYLVCTAPVIPIRSKFLLSMSLG